MVTEKRLAKISEVAKKRQRDLVLVFEDISDPHNVQAVVRTADAFGVQHIYVVFDQSEKVDLKKLGHFSSSSANKWATYHIFDNTKACLAQLKKDGFTIYATALTEESKDFFDTDFTENEKVALLFGNEHAGLTEQAIALADHTIKIPMQGIVESLNLSVMAGLTIYEVFRQRRASKVDYTLTDAAVEELVQEWSR